MILLQIRNVTDNTLLDTHDVFYMLSLIVMSAGFYYTTKYRLTNIEHYIENRKSTDKDEIDRLARIEENVKTLLNKI